MTENIYTEQRFSWCRFPFPKRPRYVSCILRCFAAFSVGFTSLFVIGGCRLENGNCKTDNRKSHNETDTVPFQADKVGTRLSQAKLIDAAKPYVRAYFDRVEEVFGASSDELERSYFDQKDFAPHAEFDPQSRRWRVWFSNGLPGAVICIEMNESATLGTLITASGNIPTTTEKSQQEMARSDPPLVNIRQFRQAMKHHSWEENNNRIE